MVSNLVFGIRRELGSDEKVVDHAFYSINYENINQ
jgi:hypothetical protein